MRQVEISRTIVFDAPRHARGFFEALIADNLDIGRPHNVEIIFARKIRRDTKGVFRTAIDRRDNGGVLVNVFYKHSRIKQYLKDGRAMRIETVVNAPRDLGCNARLPNLDELQAKARAANRRILEAERAGQGTVLASPAFERIAHPSVDDGWAEDPGATLRRSSGHGPGRRLVPDAARRNRLHQQEPARLDRRAARQHLHPRPDDLRPTAAAPQRPDPPAPHTNRYVLTADGIRIAVFYTKVYNRLLVPLTAANQPQAPPELRAALAAITRHVDDYANHARLPRAA